MFKRNPPRIAWQYIGEPEPWPIGRHERRGRHERYRPTYYEALSQWLSWSGFIADHPVTEIMAAPSGQIPDWLADRLIGSKP